ncbi:hypothetical protein [Thalassotalea sp. Y01]|uniref:hypothetical protein n=1 Tax=Thalassotalea sp. Y01 TaxID=2729613 RepID=UPI00145F82FC|nr:hypothetical protein [Thalassotalea sp. Y01]NMP17299.1 hypothetical protein [Thalassotalea sp. Y01]
MNKLAIVAATLLLIFGGVLWFLASVDWNGFIRSQIEIVGSKLTENTVTVDKVDLKLTEGFGGIYGIAFNNPSKYQQKNAFYLGEVSLDIDLKTITKQPIVLESVKLIDPQVFVEFEKDGSNNISDLMKIINSKFDKNGQPNEDVQTDRPAKQGEEKRIAISNLELAGIALTLDLTKVNGKTMDVEIPASKLGNIGGSEGLPASQIGAVVAKEVFSQISKETKKQFEKAAKQQLKDKVEKETKGFFDKLRGKSKDEEPEKQGS